MLFNFELFPIEEIGPWTNGSGEEKHLHWFGLTLGYYWIDTGAGELFRYTPEILEYWAQSYPSMTKLPYVDYQVSRLWEDVLHILPSVLEPIPNDLAGYIRPEGLWGTDAGWDDWTSRAFEWANDRGYDAAWDELEFAFRWWSSRGLDSGYLTKPPHIWFWSEGDQIYIQWDNRRQTIEGISVWASASGQVTMPVADFVTEIRSFDKRLIEAMTERIDSIRRHWSRPEIHIDIPGMMKDHAYRATLLDAALTPAREPTDWDLMRASLTSMERHLAGVTMPDRAAAADAD